MSNYNYELTDARIDEIISKSQSRVKPAILSDLSSTNPKRVYKPEELSVYKKYGGDDDDGDSDDRSAKISETPIIDAGTRFFPPTNNNQLLWCFYIAHNGMFAYETMGNAFVAENAFKYATVDRIRANTPHIKSQFKRYRIPLSNFEAELVTSKTLSLSTLVGLALCYDRNVLYIDNRKYFEINATGYVRGPDVDVDVDVELESVAYTVIEKIKNKFCVFSVAEKNAVSFTLAMRRMCRSTFWKMESITSPLKSVSYYTVAELQDIYERLNIKHLATHHIQKKMTKADLYAAIVQNIG
jgi:hypothetical protein